MLFLLPPLSRSLRRCCFRLPLLSSFFRSSPQSGRCETVRYPGRKFKFSSLAEFSEFECDESCDDAKATEKDNALRQAIFRLAGDFGRESMMSLQRFFGSRHAPVISTGSLRLDLALGNGGLPKGRIVEIYGREASGKTTLALHIIKEAQRLGGFCAYFDVENAMDTSLAESMGLNTANLLISRPDSAENLLSVVNTLAKCGSVDVIVIDSVAALVPQCELDGTIGDCTKDVQSRIMTQALRKIHQSLSQSRALVVFLNQVRLNVKPGKSFGRLDEVTCGGNSLKFYAAVRLRMIRTGLLKNTDNEVSGLGICVQVVKNKLGPTLKKVDLEMQFGKGFRTEAEMLNLACDHGIIFREGSNYLIEGKVLSSKHEAEQFLMQNDDIFYDVVMLLRNRLFEEDS